MFHEIDSAIDYRKNTGIDRNDEFAPHTNRNTAEIDWYYLGTPVKLTREEAIDKIHFWQASVARGRDGLGDKVPEVQDAIDSLLEAMRAQGF